MDDQPLDELLQLYRAVPLSTVPGNLRQNVWREIRRREADLTPTLSFDGFLNWFQLRHSGLTLLTLVLAAVLGLCLSVVSLQPSQFQRTQRALGLDAFSNDASPLTRLADSHE